MKKEELIRRILRRYPRTVDSKNNFYLIHETGMIWNKAKTWQNYREIIESGWTKPVCMRARNGTARKNVKYNISLEHVAEQISEWEKSGIKEDDIVYNQSMPDEHLTIQGEIMQQHSGLYLLYSTVQKPMNQALEEESNHAFGLTAKLLLQKYFDNRSYEQMQNLFDFFARDCTEPSIIIEFGAYDINVGNIPGRNTVVWEIRDY